LKARSFPSIFALGESLFEQRVVDKHFIAAAGLDKHIGQVAIVFVGLGGPERD
jgi:hypothetical protein